MKVVIELQDAFRNHYEEDKFEDSLRRIYTGLYYLYKKGDRVSSRYELELLDELKRAFPRSYQIDDNSGEEMDEVFNLKRQVEREKVEDGYYSY